VNTKVLKVKTIKHILILILFSFSHSSSEKIIQEKKITEPSEKSDELFISKLDINNLDMNLPNKFLFNIDYKFHSLKELNHLVRAQMLLPCFTTNLDFLHIDLTLLNDNFSTHEINFGAGYRHYYKELCVMGCFCHFDIRYQDKKIFYQFNLGLEYFLKSFDIRLNIYIPIRESKQVTSKALDFSDFQESNDFILKVVETTNEKSSYKGFDFSFITDFHKSSKLKLGPGAAYFFNENEKDENKKHLKIIFAKLDFMVKLGTIIKLEYSWDNVRKHKIYFGFCLSNINKTTFTDLSKIQKKMFYFTI